MKKSIVTAFLLTIISFFSLSAQIQLSDSAKISLMTASPWPGAIYSVYGHTVLTVTDDSTGVNAAFNYGYFDTSQPGFMYHFIRGETDYVLGVISFDDFLLENQMRGVEVITQELNLSKEQKQQLWKDLYINALPENQRYRYNFFFDNCATRPRDMVERVIKRPVIYPATNSNKTFRNLIHECVGEFSWMEFGIDLVIGSDADDFITDREKMFLPNYLMYAFTDAKIQINDTISPSLVKSTEILLEASNQGDERREWILLKPFSIAFVLLILTIVLSFFQARFHHNKTALIYDTILFSVAGFAGLIIAFLVFFSEHPATSNNWNLIWLHPFHLIIAVLFWFNSFKKVVYWYHFINFAVLSLFLIGWYFIPQQLPLAIIPFAMSLWLRSGTEFLIQREYYLKNRQYKSAKYMQAGWRR